MRVDKGQQLNAYSFALDTFKASQAALIAASTPFAGHVPDALLLCTGSSQPRFFVEQAPEQFLQEFVDGYWVQAWTVLV